MEPYMNETENQNDSKQRSSKIIKKDDISEMIEILQLKNKYSEVDSTEIFYELDKNAKGELNFNMFIQALIEKSRKTNERFSDFYLSAINFFLTPSEQIVETIKKAISKLTKHNEEKRLVKELEWVINTLSEKDLFDFRLKNEYIESLDYLEDYDYLKFLSEYSNDKFKREKNRDLELISNNNVNSIKRSSTTSSVSDIDLQMLLPSKSYSSISIETLKSIDDINFNIFKFQEEVGRDLTLPAIGNYIFASWNLFDTLNLKRFEMFLTRTRLGYKNNPYHNDIHAADVLQTTMIIFRDGKIPENAELSCLDISSVFVSCLLHDIGHPGLNNSYQMNKMTKMALKYNDKSVLENFHCYEGYKILINCDSNILEGLKKEEVRIFRKRLIESILATDMSSHTKVYAIVKSRIDAVYLDTKSNNKINAIIKGEDNMSKFDKQQDLINFIVHAADISNPAKSFSIYEKWTECINKEFFHQGDLEKKESLPVSFLCDRTTTNVPKSQIGFINSIVWPLFKVLSFLIPESRYYESQLENNAEIWKKQLESQTEKK